MIACQVSECLALALPFTRDPGAREHALRLCNRPRVAAEEEVDLAPPLIGFHDTLGRNGRHDAWSHFQDTSVVLEGRLGGVGVLGFVAGAEQIFESLLPLLALHEVMGQLLIVIGKPVRVQLFDGVPYRFVQLLTPLYQKAVISDILDDCVLEDIGWLGE